MKIPLAWLQLTHEKMRLLVALAGIAFADILMFMQMGFRDALFASNVTLHNSLQGDIFLISPQSQSILALKSFPSRRLYQSIAFDGVKSIRGIYMDYGLWKNPQTRETRNVLVIGFNPTDNVFNLSGVTSNLDTIKMPDVVLFDDSSRPEYGPIAEEFNQGKEITTEVKERRIRVGGLFTLGASFAADGNVITSDLNFLRLFPDRHKGLIDIGLIKLEPGLDVEIVVENMRRELSKDVRVLSKEEFVNWEKAYWQSSTSIGFIFTLGSAMGFIVGTVIVYQILYTDVADHLPEYATLKAMGYKTRYLLIVVFQEALILAILGYFPGYGLALGLYSLTKNATSLPIAMSLARAVTVLILTIIMCCISGAIAIGKLQAADPADIF
ncbi:MULTISPECIES: ABC transporter permease DevC [Moorena]|uniref:DevC protein n=1 Tax=Moorena producens 3L TaxID=489825 RepID=F4XUH9_9CYAN|nr:MULTISPECIES: ABC transporter permease DevC [Moorena]EGJ31804.1 DevC protein [Moorena producens 3L]NEP33597.1 FtsX-like permease family protein [Moorena sp. SIO3B2]NEP66573.1 FtsX-like permease family protein [Moorena sp. SIO3A5]NEQ07815.1 FtsX-like permease family protein [Moorena sp. SIO4E2]NER86328.1 FtsX-like permease family protein [Moorena sp. SIO3A2]